MSRRIFLIIFWLIAAGLFNFRSPYAKSDIQWDMQELFGHKSQNEDITEILRQISRRNKMKLVILPGVRGTETFDFVHFPLQGVFNLIITKHDLDYQYDKSTNTLTVSNMGDPMLRAGSSEAPTKPEPEPSLVANDAIKTVERELDEMIQKEQLATRMAETQILQFKELEAQRRVVYLAEANVNRLFQSGASLQEQISAAEEAKKEANTYLALQAKHEDELEKLGVGGISTKPKLKVGILKPPPVGAEFRSRKRKAIKPDSVGHKLASQRNLKALDEQIKVLAVAKRKDEIAFERRSKEQKERIAELMKTSERLDRDLSETRRKLETLARNQTQKISEMQEQVSTQRNLWTEAELKERLAKGKLKREQIQHAYSMNETSELIAQIKLKAKIREQQHAKRVAELRAERKKINNSQKRLAMELRLKEKQWAKSELELQTTLKQVRQAQKQASLKNEIKIQKQKNREQELEAKLVQMRQSQKQAELQSMIDTEKNAKKERKLQLKLEKMQNTQVQAILKAKLDTERQTQRKWELEARLEQSSREKVAAEKQVVKAIDITSRRKANADELCEIAEREKMEKQKLEAEKLSMLSELAAHKEELERLKRKKPTKDKLKLVRKPEPNSQSISANSFEALAAARKPIDATWLYKLTGIGRSVGSLYATIDGKDYKIGGRFAGMKIVQIERDKVLCIKQTKDGLIPYVVGFRRR